MTARDAATDSAGVPAESATADEWVPGSDPAASTDAVEADAETAADDAAEGATDDTPATPEKRRGRRHRHAAGDDAERTGTAAAETAAADAPARPRRKRWPLVALLVVAALFAGAMVALWAVTRPDPIAGLSSSQQAAVDAASQAAVNLQTFRRASFDQDFANALASLTPDYGSQQFAPRKDDLKKQLTAGARDATATVQSSGLVSSTSTQAVVLVVTTTVQTADDGTSTPFVFSRLQLTLQLMGGKWLVSDLKSVGLS